MNELDLQRMATPDLLSCFARVLEELQARGVVRTRNNPVADYAEWLTSQRLGLDLAANSRAGYDAIGPNGDRFQIKSRRLASSRGSRQLSVIRNLAAKQFDYLIAIVFDNDFIVTEAYKMPHDVIGRFARFSQHQNGHILHLRGEVLNESGVENITAHLAGSTPEGPNSSSCDKTAGRR
ncbi:MAG: hypothetical protein MUP15_00230 [Dehalococcoidia bacterium]|nr:hypothetical protein [Dehalococcoidia bacterium]